MTALGYEAPSASPPKPEKTLDRLAKKAKKKRLVLWPLKEKVPIWGKNMERTQ